MTSDANPAAGDSGTDPRPAAVTFVTTNHSAVAGFAAGGIAALAILVVLMHVQSVAWRGIAQHRFFEGD